MALILLAGCLHPAGHEPGWVARPASAFSPSDYLVAVGQADSREQANQAALAELARQIRVSVRDEFDSIASAEVAGAGGARGSRTRVQRQIRVVTDQTLEGARIARHWSSGSRPSRHYSLAVLDKAVYAEGARKDMTRLDRQIERLLSAPRSPSPLQRLHDLTRALDKSRQRGRRNRALIAVTGAGEPAPSSPNAIQRRIDDHRSSIKLALQAPPQWLDPLQGAVRARGLSVDSASAQRMKLHVERGEVRHEDGWFWLRVTLVLDWTRKGETLGSARLPLKVSSTDRSTLEGRLRDQVAAGIPRLLASLLTPPSEEAPHS